jgi:hypothetical protein
MRGSLLCAPCLLPVPCTRLTFSPAAPTTTRLARLQGGVRTAANHQLVQIAVQRRGEPLLLLRRRTFRHLDAAAFAVTAAVGRLILRCSAAGGRAARPAVARRYGHQVQKNIAAAAAVGEEDAVFPAVDGGGTAGQQRRRRGGVFAARGIDAAGAVSLLPVVQPLAQLQLQVLKQGRGSSSS